MSEYIVDVGNADEEYIAYFGQMAEKLIGNPIREEIVRCRDCANLNIVGKCQCGFWALENLNCFCAWAKRKEGGE